MSEGGDRDLGSVWSEFLFSLVHDLKAPLRTVQGFARLLEEELTIQPYGESRAYLERILGATETLNELAEALARLARASAPPHQYTSIDVAALAAAQIEKLRQRGWNVQAHVEGRIDAIGDPIHFELLLGELLRNAFLATRSQPQSALYVANVEASGLRGFVLSDNGIGLPDVRPEELFTPFRVFRRRAEWPGSGLGLSIARAALRHYRGAIALRAGETAGTVVTCTWPTTEVPAGAA
jgi:signal transduction histidine kinase